MYMCTYSISKGTSQHSQPVSSQAADYFPMEKKPKKKRAKLPRKARIVDGVRQSWGLQRQ